MSYSIKCHWESENKREIRRFSLESPSFANLQSILQKSHGPAKIFFFDDEDWCLIDSDKELAEAFKVADGTCLKLTVKTDENENGPGLENEEEDEDAKAPVNVEVQPDEWRCVHCTLLNHMSSISPSDQALNCILCGGTSPNPVMASSSPVLDVVQPLERIGAMQSDIEENLLQEQAAEEPIQEILEHAQEVPGLEENPVQEQVELAEEAPVPHAPPGVQHGIPCKLCGLPIAGDRFKCIICFNLDMCFPCQSTHPADHPLILAKSTMNLPARPPVSWFFKRALLAPPITPLSPSPSGNNRVPCRYWSACYRKNPRHLAQYLHPDDEEEEEELKIQPHDQEATCTVVDTADFVNAMDNFAFYEPINVEQNAVNEEVEEVEEAGLVADVDVVTASAEEESEVEAVAEVSVAVAAVAIEAAGWDCLRCTYRNEQGVQACSVCESSQPWTCAQCTYVNVRNARNCDICAVARQ